jgi:CO/xanthine dehydrogenase Mo-binding subunit
MMLLFYTIIFNLTVNPSNIAGTLEHKKGDIEEGFAQADVIIERDFKTEAVHQGYLETHSCLVSVAADGRAYSLEFKPRTVYG